MQIGGICGECHKYYDGESCTVCKSRVSGNTVNIILDIPEHYNRGLGQVVRGRAEYYALLKEKKLVEIGNEKKYVDPENVRRKQEQQQERAMYKIRPEAHKMLSYYEEHSQWN